MSLSHDRSAVHSDTVVCPDMQTRSRPSSTVRHTATIREHVIVK
jgi:hypothetical protein